MNRPSKIYNILRNTDEIKKNFETEIKRLIKKYEKDNCITISIMFVWMP